MAVEYAKTGVLSQVCVSDKLRVTHLITRMIKWGTFQLSITVVLPDPAGAEMRVSLRPKPWF